MTQGYEATIIWSEPRWNGREWYRVGSSTGATLSEQPSTPLPESGTNNAAGPELPAVTSARPNGKDDRQTSADPTHGDSAQYPAPAAPTGETLRFGLDGPQPVELGDCRPYLKDGETVAECIARNRKDADMLLGELAKERLKREELIDAAQRMSDAVGAHDNQNMPWSVVRSARENLLSALKGLPTTPVSATRTSGKTVRDAREVADEFSGPPAIVSAIQERSDEG